MNDFYVDYQKDLDEVFFDEFAITATLECAETSKTTKVILNQDPDLVLNNDFATKALYFYIKKIDFICPYPKIKTDLGTFNILNKEDDGSAILKVFVSKDNTGKVEI